MLLLVIVYLANKFLSLSLSQIPKKFLIFDDSTYELN